MTGPTQDVFCLILPHFPLACLVGYFQATEDRQCGKEENGQDFQKPFIRWREPFSIQRGVFLFLFFKSILVDGLLAHGKKIAGSTPLCVVYTWGQLAILEIEHECQAAKVLELCLHVTLCGQ